MLKPETRRKDERNFCFLLCVSYYIQNFLCIIFPFDLSNENNNKGGISMKLLNSFILGSCLLTGSLCAMSFGGGVGPVSVDINDGDYEGYDNDGYQNQDQGRWGNRGGWGGGEGQYQ